MEVVPQAAPTQPCEAPCCGGSPREGARSELASGAATGGGGRHAPPTRTRMRSTMSAMATEVRFEVETKDVEYQQQAGKAWLARVYRPIGNGPFPTVVDVH